MALHIIGLGLSCAKDITVAGLETVRSCPVVYLENYTSLLQCSVADLESLYGCKVVVCDRGASEQGISKMVSLAKTSDVAFLVIGDPVSATTHMEMYREAKEAGVKVSIVNNASVFTAIGVTGLQLYKFGKTTSIPFLERVPGLETPYHVIKANKSIGAHTLCLLDIMVDNVDLETGNKAASAENTDSESNTKFMTVKEALEVLLDIEKRLGEELIDLSTKVVAVARLGCSDMIVKYGSISELLDFDFGGPLHSLVVPGDLHFHEEELLEMWK
ncbi:diphthine synthase [archaeon]|nr:diphthine synthase [archaeon]MBT6698298.1 diphthine synthase [archaeon]